MSTIVRLSLLFVLTQLSAIAFAQGAIGNGVPQARQVKLKSPNPGACAAKARKANRAASNATAAPVNAVGPCNRVLAAELAQKTATSRRERENGW